MDASQVCPICGMSIVPGAPQGLCPECLIRSAFETKTGNGSVTEKPVFAPASIEEVAKFFPQLEVIQLLGHGGMGAVYKVRQPRLGRFAALKLLSPEKENSPRFAERFEREARTLGLLTHPNIVMVYDFGEIQGRFYLLMEFVDGLTLRQIFRGRKLTPVEALGIVPKICEALQYAHEQGVVHRDIKPENILVDKKGLVKIADFGIAKILNLEPGNFSLTGTMDVVGTPHYMAPEQIENPQVVDGRADIYSLGVVFYEMLTGELPMGMFQPPSQRARIDARLDRVVIHALEKEASHRYQHANQMKTDVETIVASMSETTEVVTRPGGISASRPSRATGLVAEAQAATRVATGSLPAHSSGQKGTSGSGGRKIVAAVVVLIVLAAIVYITPMQLFFAPKLLPGMPVIISFSPASGSAGMAVTIHGINFDPVPGNNIVFFGAVRAAVNAASTTYLAVTIPAGAQYAPITEAANGMTAYSRYPFLPSFSGVGTLSSSSFAGNFNIDAGNGPVRVLAADIDGDGKPDLVVANDFDQTVWIYHNISASGTLTANSFAPPVILQVGTKLNGRDALVGLAVADLTGSGRLDIILADRYTGNISIFQNLCSPGEITTNSFGARIDIPVAGTPTAVAVRDMDGDGKPDIITVNTDNNSISILRNINVRGASLGSNSFAPAVSFPTGPTPTDLAIGDMDRDGKPDVVTGSYTDNGQPAISVLRNISAPGNIVLAPHVDFAGPSHVNGLALGDLDGDGKLDVVVACGNLTKGISVYRNTSTPGDITTNSFAQAVNFDAGGWANVVALGDLDGDGKLDIVTETQSPNHISLFRNMSSRGSFTKNSLGARIDLPSGDHPQGLAISDLDGNERPDLIFNNQYDNTVSIAPNISPYRPVTTSRPNPPIVPANSF
jgi:serine/threonine protein kinase